MDSSGRSSSAAPRLDAEELARRCDEILFGGLHGYGTLERVVGALRGQPRAHQEFALRWADVAAQLQRDLGYQVAVQAPNALALLGEENTERWILDALDAYDRKGLAEAAARLRDPAGFGRRLSAASGTVRFDEVERRIGLFVQGLSGRPMGLESAEAAWTDTESIFLPALFDVFPRRQDNLDLGMVSAALLWAQARFGTFDAELGEALACFPDRQRAIEWLGLLEALRLEGCIKRHLPGLARDMARLRGELPAELAEAAEALATAEASVATSLDLLRALGSRPLPARFPYVGTLRPEEAARKRAERQERDRRVLASSLRVVGSARGGGQQNPYPPRLEARSDRESLSVEISLDGEVVALPPEAMAAARSIVQDFGALPPECLVPAGPGPWTPTEAREASSEPAGRGGARFLYDEWDYRRKAYRRNWCALTEWDCRGGDPEYVGGVRARHRGEIAQVRRRFEALRPEDRIHRRQPHGEDIDLDAAVAARADRRAGVEPGERLFCRRDRSERSLAVVFMVDMSGSTRGWVNDAERESLVMLCEALEVLGDRYAIYGFSGWTRLRCEVYRVKSFEEPYSEEVRARIAGIDAKDYTRMGPAIRHLTRLLAAQPARHHLLVTISDGKPDDFTDEYRSQYGIEDTRRALQEARQAGVRAFCVTIDRHGADYLPHMYGPASYVVLDDARKLPLKLSEIYRRLTQ